jgi:hypothetical protein
MLHVVGSPSAIADVRKQLDGLTGPTMMVSAAVWAELMRTRTNPDPLEAAVGRIQQQSGCRIHVERGEPKARIFGPKAKAGVAQRLLEELDGMCVQLAVVVADAAALELEELQTFAQEFGVTLQVEEKQVTVLGIAGAVIEAAKAIQRSDPDQNTVPPASGSTSEIACSAIQAAMSDLVGDGDIAVSPRDTSTMMTQDSAKGSLQGAVMSSIPSVTAKPAAQKPAVRLRQMEKAADMDTMGNSGECPMCGCGASFCSNCGNSIKRIKEANGCPGCGAVNFCVYCGQPTERMRISQQRGMKGSQPDFPDDSFDVSPKMSMYVPAMQNVQGSPMVMTQNVQGAPGMMTMCMGFPMGQQNAVAMSGIPSGVQAGTTMLVNQNNGMQMVPMAFGSFE